MPQMCEYKEACRVAVDLRSFRWVLYIGNLVSSCLLLLAGYVFCLFDLILRNHSTMIASASERESKRTIYLTLFRKEVRAHLKILVKMVICWYLLTIFLFWQSERIDGERNGWGTNCQMHWECERNNLGRRQAMLHFRSFSPVISVARALCILVVSI